MKTKNAISFEMNTKHVVKRKTSKKKAMPRKINNTNISPHPISIMNLTPSSISKSNNNRLNRSYSLLTTNTTSLHNNNSIIFANFKQKALNLSTSHISYELISKKKNAYEIENASLKHDILILLSQLKAKDELIASFAEKKNNYSNSYLVSLLNDKVNECESKIRKLQAKNSLLRKQNESLLRRSICELSQCKQYNFSYIVYQTITKSQTISKKQKTFQIAKRDKQTKLCIYKPYNSENFLCYDIFANVFKLEPFIDYNGYISKMLSSHNYRYVTINNILYLAIDCNNESKDKNIFLKYNSQNKTLTKLQSENYSHKNGFLLRYKNFILSIGGESTISELYDIENDKWLEFALTSERSFASFACFENGDLIGISDDNTIAKYDSKNKKWIYAKVNINLHSNLLFVKDDNSITMINDKSANVINVDTFKISNVNNEMEVAYEFDNSHFVNGEFCYVFDIENNIHIFNRKHFSHHVISF